MFHEPMLNNPHYNDCYFSYDDGLAEALYVFVEGNNLVERFHKSEALTIAETGFGTGLNLIAMIRALRVEGISKRTIRFISVERYPLSVQRISQLIDRFTEQLSPEYPLFIKEWEKQYPNLSEGWNKFSFEVETITVKVELFYGDVIDALESLSVQPDAWFLDGHSPDKNPDMWNKKVLALVGEKSGADTTLATFTAAGIVKEGLREGGFFIKRKKGFGGKRHMITGKISTEPSSD